MTFTKYRPRLTNRLTADPVRQKATQKTSIMEKQLTIEVSSGEDSDMEFLGDGTSSHGIEDCDSSDKEMGIIATKGNMTQLEPGRTVQLEPIIPEIQGRKATNLKNGTWEYICKRCHKPGENPSVISNETIWILAVASANYQQAII